MTGDGRNAWCCDRTGWPHLHVAQSAGYMKSVNLDLRSSGMLCSVDWQLFTDVSGQPVGPMCKGQAIQEQLLDR
jgi:hypothetical protein